jgi:hypothetical protein
VWSICFAAYLEQDFRRGIAAGISLLSRVFDRAQAALMAWIEKKQSKKRVPVEDTVRET